MDASRHAADPPEHVGHLVRHDWARLDPRLPEYLEVLARHGASEIWHKHGTFLDHLLGVWRILAAWRQPADVCRLGLMHSIYSNSFVRMKVFDAERAEGRAAVRELVGDEAERLVHVLCEIRREELLRESESEDGMEVSLFRRGGSVRLSRRELGIFLTVTMADYAEQHFAWQDRLFASVDGLPSRAGNPHALWPGDNRPGLWMSFNARLGRRVAACGVEPLPPVFDRCSAELEPGAEREARDLYWQVVCEASERDDAERAEELLRAATRANPFVAEPHVLLAQLALGRRRWDDALVEARTALEILGAWGTSWDKRLSWEAWVAWARVLAKGARERSWPDSALGIVSLGEVRPGA
ncbi:MAG: DUF6817 domain-containing protein [Thermodesulfobacteriota bacterium]